MHRTRVLACTLLLLLLAGRPVWAEAYIAPFLGFSFGGDAANCLSLTLCDEHRRNWGVSFGTMHGLFGLEQDIGYAPDFFGTSGGDSAVLTVMSNVMVRFPSGPVRPYGLIGLGLIRPHAHFDIAGLATTRNTLGYDIGGGVMVLFQRHVGVSGDVRHFRTFEGLTFGVLSNDQLEFWRGSVAVVFRF